jgi:hypothetical protein
VRGRVQGGWSCLRCLLCAMAVPAMPGRAGGTPLPHRARCLRYVSCRACAATAPTAHAHGSATVGTEGLSAQLFLILSLDSVDNRYGEVCAAGRRVVAPAWRHVRCVMAVPAVTGRTGGTPVPGVSTFPMWFRRSGPITACLQKHG